MGEQLLDQLNESQRAAVEYCDGASLVIAGAGAGKTRVLTYKIAYLLDVIGLKPWNILALTFTNKAAREMRERIEQLVGTESARYLQMGTFHSVFFRILRNEAEKVGYSSNFTIYDQSDSRSLVKNICKEMGLDDKQYKPSAVSDAISMAKNRLIMPQAFAVSSLFDSKHPKVAEVYQRYVERCKQANAMDFDDLLVRIYQLFEDHEDVRQRYVERYHYVLVDEYQDTNYVQQKIVYQLTRERQRVCVVGDDAQSIYSFRGANIDNILNFREAYTGARLFKLERNYRSTQLIVEAANSLIRKNERQIPKEVYSRNEHGERLTLKPAYSDKEEAMIVCKDIVRLKREEHGEYSDFAILYRTNAQSRAFEEQMHKMNIPYRIYGGMSFYQRKEIKDVIAYFRVVTNPDDEEALRRIINYPTRGIGDTTLSKIVNAAAANGVSLWQTMQNMRHYGLTLSAAAAGKIETFRQMIEGWRGRLASEDVYQLGQAIIMESGISKEIYGSREPEYVARQENLEEFLGSMQDFVESRKEEGMEENISLGDFLQEVALLTDLDSDDNAEQPKVSLMTVHSAKGLEFPTVFVVGLEENIFPSPMSTNSMRELEEERRLLYVAITRAEKHCILTCAQNRFRYGRMEYDTPSRFIRDIDPSLLFVDDGNHRPDNDAERAFTQRTTSASTAYRPSFQQAPNTRQTISQSIAPHYRPVSSKPVASGTEEGMHSLREGMTIEHQRFGIGTVLKVEGTGENEKATVEFRNAGTKQLLLKFAKIKILK